MSAMNRGKQRRFFAVAFLCLLCVPVSAAERASTPQASGPKALGRLGIVASERAVIRQGRGDASRVLSAVAQGTYLAIVTDKADHYGVLMIDGSTGWIPKSAVRRIEYQVAVGDPNAALSVEASQSADPTILPFDMDARQTALLREAFSYLGVRYARNGSTRAGMDSSGLVKAVFAARGRSLPRRMRDQAIVGEPVAWEDLHPGDRLYFDRGGKGRVSHTGIYLGNGYFLHASPEQEKVVVDSILQPDYYRDLVGARRP